MQIIVQVNCLTVTYRLLEDEEINYYDLAAKGPKVPKTIEVSSGHLLSLICK